MFAVTVTVTVPPGATSAAENDRVAVWPDAATSCEGSSAYRLNPATATTIARRATDLFNKVLFTMSSSPLSERDGY